MGLVAGGAEMIGRSAMGPVGVVEAFDHALMPSTASFYVYISVLIYKLLKYKYNVVIGCSVEGRGRTPQP